jgi:hypothetical protein
MHGNIKIYEVSEKETKLLLDESNLIVEGMGSVIAAGMTISPSLSSLPDASGLLARSNYQIVAMSLGKDRLAFEGTDGNAHTIHVEDIATEPRYWVTNDRFDILSSTIYAVIDEGSSDTTYSPLALQSEQPKFNDNSLASSSITAFSLSSTQTGSPSAVVLSSLQAAGEAATPNAIPSATMASGMLKVFEEISTRDPGHNMNWGGRPWALLSYVSGLDPDQAGQLSSVQHFFSGIDQNARTELIRVGRALGCYQSANLSGGASALSSVATFQVYKGNRTRARSTWASVTTTPGLESYLNASGRGVSCVDSWGFMNLVNTVDTSTAAASSTDYVTKGPFTISGITAKDPYFTDALHFSSTGKLTYVLGLGERDLLPINLYGGLYTFGLWAIDPQKSEGSPPYSTSSFNADKNPLRYKLLSKKSVNKNILAGLSTINDAKYLRVEWTINFI